MAEREGLSPTKKIFHKISALSEYAPSFCSKLCSTALSDRALGTSVIKSLLQQPPTEGSYNRPPVVTRHR